MNRAKFKLMKPFTDDNGYKYYQWECTEGYTFYRGKAIMPGSTFVYPAKAFWGCQPW